MKLPFTSCLPEMSKDTVIRINATLLTMAVSASIVLIGDHYTTASTLKEIKAVLIRLESDHDSLIDLKGKMARIDEDYRKLSLMIGLQPRQ